MDPPQTPSTNPPASQPDSAASGRPVLDRIRDFLRDHEIAFRELHHEPTRTSEDSARVRGEDLRIGGKALLIKVDDEFRLFVLSAALRVDSQAIRVHLNARRTRFATAGELAELTGLVPGAVPPFGRPILPFALYVDLSITDNERIAFNAGSLTDSMFLAVDDYLRVAHAQVFRFSR
jgi:Ala-tRNA(Pro) deacylase